MTDRLSVDETAATRRVTADITDEIDSVGDCHTARSVVAPLDGTISWIEKRCVEYKL